MTVKRVVEETKDACKCKQGENVFFDKVSLKP